MVLVAGVHVAEEALSDRFAEVKGTVYDLDVLVAVNTEAGVVRRLGHVRAVFETVDIHLASLHHFAYAQVVNYNPRLVAVGEVAFAYCYASQEDQQS